VSERSLRWDDLRFVLAAHRHGTLLAAARALSTHASTVGRRIEALETELGHALFDRTTSGLAPTALADELRPIAEAMESHAAEAIRRVEQQETEPEGWVRITAPPGIATYVLAPLLPRLAEAHPKIRVALVPSIGYADLTRREADLALRAVAPSAGDLVSRRLLEAVQSPCATPALVRELGRISRIDAVPWVTWDESLAALPSARWVAEHAPEEQIRFRCTTFEPLMEAARGGLGAILLGEGFGALAGLEPLRFAPKLRRELDPFPRGALYLVGHRALRDVPRVAAVWTFLLEEASNL
jgi:DNA-binding transcriptional LysR family regulator